MSQKVSRKTISEEKDKRSSNSPVKEMKKKMAANAEKEKQAAAEKTDKVEKTPEKSAEKTTEKSAEKTTEKADKSEKLDNSADKKSEKKDSAEKKKDTVDKKKDNVDKKNEPKPSESQPEKSKDESSSKEDKSGKAEKEKPEPKKTEPSKQKQNGRDRVHNGVSDVTLGNGTDDVLNGTVSADSEDDDVMLVIDDHDHDELFPELTYDDTSDVECFEPPTPENVPSRSLTRRSQVKAARTPETPRPADLSAAEPKESKVLKLKEDAPATDRKLRSADSPKPESKKQESEKKDSDNKDNKVEKETDKEASKDVVGDKSTEESKSQDEKEIEVVIEVEASDDAAPRKTDTNYSKSRVKVSPYRRSTRLADQTNTSLVANYTGTKTDTNYSKSRVKVSPYRRSTRLADQTNTSLVANYTGNNTTMEMDITESSSFMDESNLDDSSYLRGLRSIRGRNSYKPLKEITLRHVANRSMKSNTSVNLSQAEPSRPTGTVVGRKRKPDADDAVEVGVDAAGALPLAGGSKRLRVLERLAEPFRRVAGATLPARRRDAPIVGINTDLPLTAPVAAAATVDPESLKGSAPPAAPVAAPPLADNKRCVVM